MNDILRQMGTQEIARLRLGVGSPPEGMDAADYVLGRIGKQEGEALQAAVIASADAVAVWVEQGVEAAMNRYNAGS